MAANHPQMPTHRRARSDAEQQDAVLAVVRPRAKSHDGCRALVEPAFIPAALCESPKAPMTLAEVIPNQHFRAVERSGEEDLPSSAPPQARSHRHSHREGRVARKVRNVRHSTGTSGLERKSGFRSLQELESLKPSSMEVNNHHLGTRKGAIMNLITAARCEVEFDRAVDGNSDPFSLYLTA
jgi:hypothetical protein